ncbi:hypothetical protein C8Q76DRAFT_134801 [Earliella scabrosa]|nr:hypothetical protein C8Q76DRAFT_134801 [Earliella scabrosa]
MRRVIELLVRAFTFQGRIFSIPPPALRRRIHGTTLVTASRALAVSCSLVRQARCRSTRWRATHELASITHPASDLMYGSNEATLGGKRASASGGFVLPDPHNEQDIPGCSSPTGCSVLAPHHDGGNGSTTQRDAYVKARRLPSATRVHTTCPCKYILSLDTIGPRDRAARVHSRPRPHIMHPRRLPSRTSDRFTTLTLVIVSCVVLSPASRCCRNLASRHDDGRPHAPPSLSSPTPLSGQSFRGSC